MNQLTFSWEEPHANHSQSQDLGKDSKTQEETLRSSIADYLKSLDPNGLYGKTSQASLVQTVDGTLVPSSGRWLNSGMGSPTECLTLNTSEWPSAAVVSLLSDTLEIGDLPQRFYLSATACQGILRRAERRGKTLPPTLRQALEDTVKASAHLETQEEISEGDQRA